MSFWEYLTNNYLALLEQSVQHIRLVVVSVGAAIVVGVATRRRGAPRRNVSVSQY